jgi:hypothetical protein
MSAPKHTPGPWAVEWDHNGFYLWAKDERVLAPDSTGEFLIPRERGDAALIAAAPLMLEALERIEEHRIGHDGVCDGECRCGLARLLELRDAAIAAAKGEEVSA